MIQRRLRKNIKMPKNKILILSLGFISLAAAVIMLLNLHGLGFPDGHLTELDQALGIFYKAGIAFYGILSICFLISFLNKVINEKLAAIIVSAFIVITIAAAIILIYLVNNLDDGTGG